ncbi:hypothetical protein BCT83_21110, partial [Vibrio tasmaniensis]
LRNKAIKGSKFSASTGDAGGDKKGVSSGTIEAEAEFISASPTVKFEGVGVCRLSDQTGAVFEGTLDNAGKASVGGVAPGEFNIDYGEDSRKPA